MREVEKLVIPSDQDELPRVDEAADRIAREMGFSKEERDDIAISVSEAVNNAILHGNRGDKKKKVIITFFKRDDSLIVKVKDQGTCFDPERDLPQDPTSPDNILKEKGRGVFIVRHLMDEVSYNCSSDGTEMVMVKLKTPREILSSK